MSQIKFQPSKYVTAERIAEFERFLEEQQELTRRIKERNKKIREIADRLQGRR